MAEFPNKSFSRNNPGRLPRVVEWAIVAVVVVLLLAIFAYLTPIISEYIDSQNVLRRTTENANAKIANGQTLVSPKTPAPNNPEGETIVIASFPDAFWYGNSRSSTIRGYGPDLLNEVSRYTGWNYKYVLLSKADAFAKLKTGEVDFMAPTPYSADIANEFIYTSYPVGTMQLSYYAVEKSPLSYGDFDSFDGKTFGFIANTSGATVAERDSKLRGYSYKSKTYESNSALLNGLYQGEVDIAVAADVCVSKEEELKLLHKAQPDLFYFITGTNNLERAKQLNEAFEWLENTQPRLIEQLSNEYIFAKDSSIPNFTKEEHDYIEHANKLKVAFVKERHPIEFESSDELANPSGVGGVTGNILNLLADKSGLEFVGVSYPTRDEAEDALKRGEVDVLSTYIPGGHQFFEDDRIMSTATYARFPVLEMRLKNAPKVKNPIIAVPYQLRWIVPEAEKENPHATFVMVKGREESIAKITSGEVDCFYVGTIVANQLLADPRYSKTLVGSYTNFNDELTMGIGSGADTELISILNKSINSLSDAERGGVIAISAPQSRSLADLVSQYWIQGLLIISILSAAILGILFVERRANLKEIEYTAYTDPLTGLPNRASFIEHLRVLIESEASEGTSIAVLDIDNFKSINNLYSVSFGDQLLTMVGENLREALPKEVLLAHDNADIFLVAIRNMSEQGAVDVIKEAIEPLAHVNFKNAGDLELPISVGMYRMSKEDVSANAAINNADIARMRAKSGSADRILYFNEDIRSELISKTTLENDLKLAIARNEFEMYYQPKVNLFSGAVVGFEALIRWNHPFSGVLIPNSFIGVAEGLGLIQEITKIVVRLCFDDVDRLHKMIGEDTAQVELSEDEIEDFKQLTMSFNLSPHDILNPGTVPLIRQALLEYGHDPARIEIEMTESALLEDKAAAMQTITELRELGLSVALDDFGMGYSSLGHLKDLPLDIIKLDRQFIRDIEVDKNARLIIESIVPLIHNLGFEVVSEGIETEYQLEYLKEIGAETGQGYLFAKPMTFEEAYDFMMKTIREGFEFSNDFEI